MPPLSQKKPANPFVVTRTEALRSKNPQKVVAAAGDLLRRSTKYPEARVEAETALHALSSADVETALLSVKPDVLRAEMTRAGSEAFEASFADTEEERKLFADSAIGALMGRDQAESILFAAKTLVLSHGELDQAANGLEQSLRGVDSVLETSVGRSLTAINQERRGCLADLDETEKKRATWFSLDCDTGSDKLLQALAGTLDAAGVAALSESARAAVEDSALPRTGKQKTPGGFERTSDDAESSALLHVAIGAASNAERTFLEGRGKRDESLKKALTELEAHEDPPEA